MTDLDVLHRLRALDLAVPLADARSQAAASFSPLDLMGPGSAVAGMVPLVHHTAGILERFAEHNRQLLRSLEAEQIRLQRQDKHEWDRMFQMLVARAETSGLALTPSQQDIVDSIARLGEEWATRVRTVGDGDLMAMQDVYRGYVVGYGETLDLASAVASKLARVCRSLVPEVGLMLADDPTTAPTHIDPNGFTTANDHTRSPCVCSCARDLGFELDAGRYNHGRQGLQQMRVGLGPSEFEDGSEPMRLQAERLGLTHPDPDRNSDCRILHTTGPLPPLQDCSAGQARCLAAEMGVHPWWLLTMNSVCTDADDAPLGSGCRRMLSVPNPYRGQAQDPRGVTGAFRVSAVASRERFMPAIWWALLLQSDKGRAKADPLLPIYEILRRSGKDPEQELDTQAGRRGLNVAAKQVAALLDAPEAKPIRDLLCVLYPDDRDQDWWHGRGPAGYEWQRAWPSCFTAWISALYNTATIVDAAGKKEGESDTNQAGNSTVDDAWEIPASALMFTRPDPPQDWQRGWLPSELGELCDRFPPERAAGRLRKAWMQRRFVTQ